MGSELSPAPRPTRRGIYLLPNLFTTASLFAGFYAVVAAMGDRFEAAAVAIFVAMLLDGLDGRVARLTHTQTAFGTEYDSLSDMVSFGVAPALVVYAWSLHFMGKVGWLAAFIYTAGAALRLARFNTQVAVADKRYFQGLPSPSAAAIVAGLVWFGSDQEIAGESVRLGASILSVVVGLLMVSNLRYYSFKGLDLRDRVPFMTVLAVVLAFVLISIHPSHVLFFLFLAYAVSGPVVTLLQLRRRRASRRGPPPPRDDAEQT
jgi:CDP-diacylglycerol--serine O-phosphatidyltransferase